MLDAADALGRRRDRPLPRRARPVRLPARRPGCAPSGRRSPRTTAADLGYGDPRGTPALRAALVGWLARSRGVRAEPDELIVVNGRRPGPGPAGAGAAGARDGTGSGSRTRARRGTRAQLASLGHATVRRSRWTRHGLDVAELPAPAWPAVVLTPAHQFPTGVVLAARPPPGRCSTGPRAGGLVIEDDYDAEHRYDRPPVAALQALAPDGVVHLGSVSKTLAPALRLGWLLAPARAARRAGRAQARGRTSPARRWASSRWPS